MELIKCKVCGGELAAFGSGYVHGGECSPPHEAVPDKVNNVKHEPTPADIAALKQLENARETHRMVGELRDWIKRIDDRLRKVEEQCLNHKT